jgi:hypothetical protein
MLSGKSLWCVAFACCVLPAADVFAQTSEQVEVTYFSGNTEVLLKDAEDFAPCEEGMILEPGDKVKTLGDGVVELAFNEENTNVVRLSEGTEVEIVLEDDEKLSLSEGEVFASIAGLPAESTFEIRTPTAVCGVRGTEWVTRVSGEETEVEAIEHTPYVRHFEESGVKSNLKMIIQPGQMTTVRRFQPPLQPRPIPHGYAQWKPVKEEMRRHADQAFKERKNRPAFDRERFRREKVPQKKKGVPGSGPHPQAFQKPKGPGEKNGEQKVPLRRPQPPRQQAPLKR